MHEVVGQRQGSSGAIVVAGELEILCDEKYVPVDCVRVLEWSKGVGSSWSNRVWEVVGVGRDLCREGAWLYSKVYSSGVVHGLVEWVSSFDKSVFEDGKVELVGCVGVEGKCCEWIVGAVVGEVGGEVAPALKSIVVGNNPSCFKVSDVV